MQNLLFMGGVGHPFEETSAELAKLLQSHGVETTIVPAHQWEDASKLFPTADLLSFDALRWRMLADRYDHLRDEHAYSAPMPLRRAVEAHVAAGRPVLALHTSCICFDDWPWWGELLGACWDWDRSFHPELAEIRLSGTPSFNGPRTTALCDEVYHGLRVTDRHRTVLGWASVPTTAVAQNEPPLGSAGIGEPQPVLWRRTQNNARIVVDTLGHDVGSLVSRQHRAMLDDAVAWLLGGAQ